MTDPQKLKDDLEESLSYSVSEATQQILDIVEQEVGAGDRWPFIRSRLLKILMDRGLMGTIRDTLDDLIY